MNVLTLRTSISISYCILGKLYLNLNFGNYFLGEGGFFPSLPTALRGDLPRKCLFFSLVPITLRLFLYGSGPKNTLCRMR